jgi:hypothetical protein
MYICLICCGLLILLIFSLMICSCKKNKLLKMLKKIYNSIMNYIKYLNEDDGDVYLKREDKEFSEFIGPKHQRH